MLHCQTCGIDVTGKKFCPDCGTAVPTGITQTGNSRATTLCPNCRKSVNTTATFCMHCGTALKVATSFSQAMPATFPCPACHTQLPSGTIFCTQCGYDTRNANPVPGARNYC